MKGPEAVLDFFYGQKPQEDGTGPEVYTVILPDPSEADPVLAMHNPMKSKINVAYFYFYPFNYGKAPVLIRFGNHVGDIENTKLYFENGKPVRIDDSEHSWSTNYKWDNKKVEKQG